MKTYLTPYKITQFFWKVHDDDNHCVILSHFAGDFEILTSILKGKVHKN